VRQRVAQALCELRRASRKRNIVPQLRQTNTTGKSSKACPSLRTKIFGWRRRANQ
jgi:hypothetical protein